MNRKEFNNNVNNLIKEAGISPAEAVAIVQEQYLNESRQRRELEEINSIEVEKLLRSNPESKTMVIPIWEVVPKDRAMAIAHSTIKVNKFHFITQLVHSEKDTWLVASEFPISQGDAMKIMENLTAEKYSEDEIDVIVTKFAPFDIR
jgi:hypothetical protein